MNLRKDHYRLLVLTDLLTRLTPPRDWDRLRSLLGALTCLSKLSTPCPDFSISCLDVVGQGGPRLLRYRTPDAAAATVAGAGGMFDTVQRALASARVCDLPHVGMCSQALSFHCLVETVSGPDSGNLNNTTLYSGSFGSGVDEERS